MQFCRHTRKYFTNLFWAAVTFFWYARYLCKLFTCCCHVPVYTTSGNLVGVELLLYSCNNLLNLWMITLYCFSFQNIYFVKSVFDCMVDFVLGPLSTMCCSKLVYSVKIDINSNLPILKQIALLHFYCERNSI